MRTASREDQAAHWHHGGGGTRTRRFHQTPMPTRRSRAGGTCASYSATDALHEGCLSGKRRSRYASSSLASRAAGPPGPAGTPEKDVSVVDAIPLLHEHAAG